MGRSKAESAGAYRKGARQLRAPVKQVRKRSAKKTKQRATKRVKTGAYAGPIIAAKSVPMTKRCVRIRERLFNLTGGITAARRIWVGGNTIGDEQYLFSLLSEAILEHILSKIGDTRADKEKVNTVGFLKQIVIRFMKDEHRLSAASPGTAADNPVTREMRYVVEDPSSSFNGIVYNNIVGATPNLVYLDGATSPVSQRGLRDVVFDMAISGYYPEGLFVFRTNDSGTSTHLHEIYRDTMFGKSSLSISIGGVHKFQNITPADHATDLGAGYNANAIDANPLQGKIYTFGHLAPKFNKGWVGDQTASVKTEAYKLSGRPYSRAEWDYKMIGVQGDSASAGIDMPNINEFKLPPLRPRTMFSNVKTSDRVSIPPGGFKSFKTRFTFKGSISRFVRDITQQSALSDDGVLPKESTGKYPSLGDSFLMCLTPAMTSAGESVSLAFDYQKDGQAYIKKYTMGTMPTTNIIP